MGGTISFSNKEPTGIIMNLKLPVMECELSIKSIESKLYQRVSSSRVTSIESLEMKKSKIKALIVED